MTVFAPVRTLEDLDTLDEAAIIEGYTTAKSGDPEPGENRGRAFWHGWRNRMIDLGTVEVGHDRHSSAAEIQISDGRAVRGRYGVFGMERLSDEVGDLLALIEVALGCGLLDYAAIEDRKPVKFRKLAKYMQTDRAASTTKEG